MTEQQPGWSPEPPPSRTGNGLVTQRGEHHDHAVHAVHEHRERHDRHLRPWLGTFRPNEDPAHEQGESAAREAQEDAGQVPSVP